MKKSIIILHYFPKASSRIFFVKIEYFKALSMKNRREGASSSGIIKKMSAFQQKKKRINLGPSKGS